MARKSFEEVRMAFKEATGTTLSGKDLEMCKAVYEAEGNMLDDQKRTKPTRQNYGIYIERLPDDRRFAHGTMDNREKVSQFVDYCIECRKDKKLPESNSVIENLRKENAKLKKATKQMATKIVNADSMTQQFIEVTKVNNELSYKISRYEDFFRSHGINPLNLPEGPDFQEQPSERFLLLEATGNWVDTSTGEVISGERKAEIEIELEQNNSNDIDEQ